MMKISSGLWLGAGWTSLFLGTLGIFIPLLPTTPFVLLAAFCFSKGSEKVHRWLLAQPRFGAMISEWEKSGVIRLSSKCWATLLIAGTYAILWYRAPVSIQVKCLVAAILLGSLTFIWSRPSSSR